MHEKLLAAIARGERPKLFCDEFDNLAPPKTRGVLLELNERRDLHGIFHWAGSETLSRFEMGQRILRHFNMPAEVSNPYAVTMKPIMRVDPHN